MSEMLDEEEFRLLVELAHGMLWSDSSLRRRLQNYKVNIVPANFYSPVPLVDEILDSFEYRERGAEIYNHGLFDAQRIGSFLDAISPYASEFDPPLEGDRDEPKEFFWKNPAFSFSDAMAYYCILRHLKPDHVLEVGSGFSTLVADQALRKNDKGKLTLIEPLPKPFLRRIGTVQRMVEKRVQDLPLTEIMELVESADVWFIDSTHTVKIGSDCLYLYLKVLPRIQRELAIHCHEVSLPFAPPQQKALEKHIYWNEQYLLYAYMLDNPRVDVLFGSAYAKRRLPEKLERLMVGRYQPGGGSLWYRLKPGATIIP